jgi:hypothetical protein
LTLVGFVVAGIASLRLNVLAMALYHWLGITIPPQSTASAGPGLTGLVLLTNIVGEELWWRGQIFLR